MRSKNIDHIFIIFLFASLLFCSTKLIFIFSFLLMFFYGFIFVIIQMQDYSLLLGSLGLFVIIGLLMYFSKNIKCIFWATRRRERNTMPKRNSKTYSHHSVIAQIIGYGSRKWIVFWLSSILMARFRMAQWQKGYLPSTIPPFGLGLSNIISSILFSAQASMI